MRAIVSGYRMCEVECYLRERWMHRGGEQNQNRKCVRVQRGELGQEDILGEGHALVKCSETGEQSLSGVHA